MGLFNLGVGSGLQTQDFASTVPTWPLISQVPGKVARKNGLSGSLGWVWTPEMAATLMATPKISGGASGFIWEGSISQGQLAGYRAIGSPQMRIVSLEHGGAFGPWQHQIVGFWGGIQVLVDPYTQALTNQTRFVLNGLNNTINRAPEMFVIADNARTA
jgi:hypothetical protein